MCYAACRARGMVCACAARVRVCAVADGSFGVSVWSVSTSICCECAARVLCACAECYKCVVQVVRVCFCGCVVDVVLVA